MKGNIHASLDIKAGDDTVVLASGWVEFEAGDPDSVQVWVGVAQGRNNAVYGKGWTTVDRPAQGTSQRTTWQCEATTANAVAFRNGSGVAGAAVVGDLSPYPWGRRVKLRS
jgi:hypothetical protein